MCQYSATAEGFATDWHLAHLGARAAGGAGLVMIEATAILPEGRISHSDLGIWDDAHIDSMQKLAAFIRGQGAVPGLQIAHAGRKAGIATPWQGPTALVPTRVAPSPSKFYQQDPEPHALTIPEIERIITSFKQAARRAALAQIKLLEIHAAHGYLLHSFLSPLSNQRLDHYGGDFHGRIRLLHEIVKSVRDEWPEHLPLAVRLSCTDWTDRGWSISDSIKLASILKESGVDLIDCSSGGILPDIKIPVAPSYQVPFSDSIKHHCNIATAAVGLITEPSQANDILRQSQADLILIGRESLRNPNWPIYAAQKTSSAYENLIPSQYLRAY